MMVLRRLRLAIGRNMFKLVYLPGILLVATSGLLFQQSYLLHQEWTSYWTLTASNWLLYIMCFISFYQSIRIDNKIPSVIPAPRHRTQLQFNHPLYTQKAQCHRQNNRYKPPRTSHCHIDGCMARFDHHCPYINNCLAYANLKAFLLFIAYGGSFALQFLCCSIATYFWMTDKGAISYSQIVVVGWMMLTVCSFCLMIAMLGLFFMSIAYIARNVTKIDLMKGTFQFSKGKFSNPNPYDLGTITNYSTVFEGHLWSWWWPSRMIPRADGTRFPMVPPVSNQDIKSLPQNIRQELRDPSEKDIPRTIEQLLVAQQSKYHNVIFFFNGQQYRIQQERQEQRKGCLAIIQSKTDETVEVE